MIRPTRPRDHGIEHGAAADDRALEVHRDHPVPRLLGAVDERFDHVDPGVVDQHVDLAELVDHLREPGAHRGDVGHVHADAAGPRAELRADLLRRPRCGSRVQVGDRHRGALLREPGGDRQPDAAGGAGHDAHPPVQCTHLGSFRSNRATSSHRCAPTADAAQTVSRSPGRRACAGRSAPGGSRWIPRPPVPRADRGTSAPAASRSPSRVRRTTASSGPRP